MGWLKHAPAMRDWPGLLALTLCVLSLPAPADAAGWVSQDRTQGTGVYVWDDGQRYEGQVVNGKRHGRGTLVSKSGLRITGQFAENTLVSGRATYPSGDVYEGSFLNDKPSGEGVYVWKDGTRFEGRFEQGKRTAGMLMMSTGLVYTGSFDDSGRRHGQGVSTWADGRHYDGTWHEGQPSGSGTMRFPKGEVYSGQWVQGERSGEGSYTWLGGQRFVGRFASGRIAHGTMTVGAGQVYTGAFDASGQYHGQGVLSWGGGQRYEGNFDKGKPHGRGVRTWSDGRRFEGEMHQDMLAFGRLTDAGGRVTEVDTRAVHDKVTGMATVTDSSGWRYEGELLNGVRHGNGTLVSSNGDRYVGRFDQGLRAQGTLTLATGHVYTGSFDASNRYHGQGSFTWPDGQRHEGDFVAGDFHGRAVRTWPDGRRFEGEVQNNKLALGRLTDAQGKVVEVDMRAAHAKLTGVGVVHDLAGWRYDGQLLEGVPHGNGTQVTPAGYRFVGRFDQGRRAEGTLTMSNGQVYVGAFDPRGQYNGQGTYTWPDGQRYEGNWQEGAQHGQGTMVFANGDVYSGDWNAGKRMGASRNELASANASKANEARQAERAREPSISTGQVLTSLFGAALIGRAPGLDAVEKARMLTGFVSDVTGDGNGTATRSAAAQIQANRAQGQAGAGQAAAGGGSGAGDAERNRQAALACKASSMQDTGNPQVDTGCSLVAFNVCIYNSTGLTNYNAQAKAQCQMLRETWKNESVCSAPCAQARALPIR